ncbi:hypothetical protein GCM10009830_09580 [Glycomyces endophyticus]|uniref:RNA polymerase sigma-70 region 2 domain-containing protein n=1 Tax=Glycomyces endophyticus TaxID=480996 RepID=A0ABN2G7D2_9ACTN
MNSRHSEDQYMLGRGGDRTRKALFARIAALPEGDPERLAFRDRLVAGHLPLAAHIAKCYSGKGLSEEELLEAASAELIDAIDRFNPAWGDFLTFAIPSMMDAVRRRCRRTTWPQDVPHHLAELRAAIAHADAALAQDLDRPVTTADIAERLGTTEARIEASREGGREFPPDPLDRPPKAEASPVPFSRLLETTLEELSRSLLAAPVSGALRTSHRDRWTDGGG